MKKLILTAGMCVAFIATAFAQVPGDIIITEFMANPAGDEGTNEYIELYNKRSVSFDLEGFVIKDDGANSHTIVGSLVIPAEGFLVLANSVDPLGNGSNIGDYVISSSSLVNGSSGDEIVLTNSAGLEISRVNYEISSTSGTSKELNAISNVASNGSIDDSNFSNSSTAIVGGTEANGSPGAAGSTDLSEVPTLRFTTSTATVSEDAGAVNIAVILEDADGNSVSVDVVYNEASSSTTPSDFTSTSTTTLTFNTAAGNDETKNATFTVTNDAPYEGLESAVFDLSNVTTAGTAILNAAGDKTYTLKINDNATPSIVINEVNSDPEVDANGDGTHPDADDDEFVEIYNNEDVDVDISNWTINDDDAVRHTFASETTIKAKSAIVIFDDSGTPTGSFGGSTVINSSSDLSLNNSNEKIVLVKSDGTRLDSVSYVTGPSNESLSRNPDGTGAFVDHTDANASLTISPGTRVDGSPFSTRSQITGTAGWRFISSPVTTTIDNILGDIWTQGFTGADTESGTSNVYTYDETVKGNLDNGYTSVGNQSDNMTQAKGYAVYVYEDDEVDISGTQGGFPKTLLFAGSSPIADVGPISFTHTASDTPSQPNDGWNLAGNPFAKRLDVNKLGFNNNADLNNFAYVYRGGSYTALDADDASSDADTIAIGEGFFVKTTTATNYTFTYATLTPKQALDDVRKLNFTLAGQGKEVEASIRFKDGADFGLDANDAYYLGSYNASYIGLFSKENEVAVQINSYPYDLDHQVDIPLDMEVSENGTYDLHWGELENIPSSWSVTLIDNVTNEEYDLSTSGSIELDIERKTKTNPSTQNDALRMPLPKAKQAPANERFTIVVEPSTSVSNEDELEKVTEFSLEQNYPNPFNPTTSIKYSVGKTGPVTITIYNVMGQKVAEILNATQTAGSYQLTWDAAAQASGIYYYRLTAPGQVLTRQMTLIK
ncbi:MAG: lamin tail domain-containing protein [Balneola sp.]